MSTPSDRPLRIAFVVGEFPSVSQTFVYEQIAGLRALGHDVHVLADRPGGLHWGGESIAGTTYLYPGAGPSAGPRQPSTLRAALQRLPVELSVPRHLLAYGGRRSFDILHAHFGPLGLKAATLRRWGVLRGGLVTTFQGYDLSCDPLARRPGGYRRLQRAGDLFLPVSVHGRNRLERLGFPRDRIVIHPMGVDLTRFRYAPRVPPRGEPIRVLTVARLVEKKGVEYALRAVAALGLGSDRLRYEIIGDGPLAAELKGLAITLGLKRSVDFRGALGHADVEAALRRAHAFVLPSVTAANGDEEGVPVSIMEAMAVGLPVVATRHAGTPELVGDAVSGFLVAERSVEELTAALRRIVDEPGCWEPMGRAGRARIEQGYDAAVLNGRLVELYRGILRPRVRDP